MVATHASLLGAAQAVVYLADYEQLVLVPLRGPGVPSRAELTVDGSVAGLAYRRMELTRSPAHEGPQRIWIPLLDGVARVGVLELVLSNTHVDESGLEDRARVFAALVAELLMTHDTYSDLFLRLRRRRPLSLAAEIHWELLPPLTFATERLVISGALEPAYDIGGDSFDYAVNESTAELMVLDAVGHGLPAALLSSAAVGAYRHARRDMRDLRDIAAAMNSVIAEQFLDSQFATGVLARLDLETGLLSWVNAGHPEPLIVRDGTLIRPPHCPPGPPLGLQDIKPEPCQLQLSRGDRVLFYTDGIVEARSPTGDFFGEQRLGEFIIRASAAGEQAPETLRRLMRYILNHQAGQLQDDASIVLVEWHTGSEEQLVL
ncbi:PP2C family protein-serine/threonine phosphatase [Blastococcus sp. CCUG 61487]|uniref:PP2C family protein-serine/threonine phosphatase n=1 Tax=Blastococcus sp. CCUG 61487 TaxID=1840703 RepID=UPI0010C04C38|nr:PP2C family protein-serine/threonine phosphatase [Blastococcus sp. CCUG 61487]